MESHARKLVCKKNKKNRDISTSAPGDKSRTHKEILAENDRLRGTVNELTRIIKEMKEERGKLKNEISNLHDDVINSLVVERDEILESKFLYMDKLKESQRRIQEMEEERDKPNAKMDTVTQGNIPKQDCVVATASEIPAAACDSGIGMDLDSFKQHIERKIDSLIDVKLNERLAGHINAKQEEDENPEVATNSKTIDETKRKAVSYERESNIIIHGLEETDCNTSDENKVQDIFNKINVKCKPRMLYRLGIKGEGKNRPLMVHLQSKEEKDDVLLKLWRLKYARRKNERISITHDYTLEERKLIKKLVEESKRRNMNENNKETNDFVWKVRGTPKTRMRIVKIRMEQREE